MYPPVTFGSGMRAAIKKKKRATYLRPLRHAAPPGNFAGGSKGGSARPPNPTEFCFCGGYPAAGNILLDWPPDVVYPVTTFASGP